MLPASETRRQRTGKPKSHTGCRTCRLRRVKCDEARPTCMRCVSAGRVCDGYEAPIVHYRMAKSTLANLPRMDSRVMRRPSVIAPSLSNSPLLSALGPTERNAFCFYQDHLAPQFDGAFQSNLWQKRALQLSHSVPALLYAVIGLGLVYQARMSDDGTLFSSPHFEGKLYESALVQHTRALGYLQSFISSTNSETTHNENALEVVVLTCLLFISFDLLQGNRNSATTHFRTGLRILQQQSLQQTPIRVRLECRGSTSDIHSNDLSALEAIFNLMGSGIPYPRVQLLPAWSGCKFSADLPKSFQDLSEAGLHLDILSTAVYQIRDELVRRAKSANDGTIDLDSYRGEKQFLRQCCEARSSDLSCKELDNDMKMLRERHMMWLGSFRQYPREGAGLRHWIQLFIKSFYSRLVLANLLDTEALACDEFDDEFPSILDMVLQYMATGPGSQTLIESTNQTGPIILCSVYAVGIHCRQSSTRRRALRILRTSSSDQIRHLGLVLQKVIRLEESRAEALRVCSINDNSTTAHKTGVIPGQARFTDVQICTGSEGGRVLCAKRNLDGQVEVVDQLLTG